MALSLSALHGDVLLAGSSILEQVDMLKTRLRIYKDEGVKDGASSPVSYEEYFEYLGGEVQSIPTIELQSTIAPGAGMDYLRNVTMNFEAVMDAIERVSIKTLFFAGKLKSTAAYTKVVNGTFQAWYQLAVTDFLKDNDMKLPVSAIKDLGMSEFSRLLGNLDLDIEGMLDATDGYTMILKNQRKLANDKYNMAKDQVNAMLSGSPQEFGQGGQGGGYQKLAERYGPNFKKAVIDGDDEVVEPLEVKPTLIKTSQVVVEPEVVGTTDELESHPKRQLPDGDPTVGFFTPTTFEFPRTSTPIEDLGVGIELHEGKLTIVEPEIEFTPLEDSVDELLDEDADLTGFNEDLEASGFDDQPPLDLAVILEPTESSAESKLSSASSTELALIKGETIDDPFIGKVHMADDHTLRNEDGDRADQPKPDKHTKNRQAAAADPMVDVVVDDPINDADAVKKMKERIDKARAGGPPKVLDVDTSVYAPKPTDTQTQPDGDDDLLPDDPSEPITTVNGPVLDGDDDDEFIPPRKVKVAVELPIDEDEVL